METSITTSKPNKPTNLPYMNGVSDLIDNDELIMMNNDFYNDDFYDYRDTFMNGKNSTHNNKKGNHVDNSKVLEENFDVDENDNKLNYVGGDESEDDDYDDENNDFKTGPLAIRANDDDNLVSESQFFHKERYDEEDNADINYYEEEGGGQMMMDTFFKRVDSMELDSKPKKAKIVNNYLIGEVLGDGSYGKVKECIELSSLSRRAVKIINLKTVARKIPRGVENVRKEINIMKKLDHKNVIKLYDTFEKGGEKVAPTGGVECINLDKPPKLYIFMDYCMTSLEKLFKNAPNQRLCNYQANFYFKQLVDGLEYLHSLNIIHNDIKPGNLLVTCDDLLKICDFSISAQIDPFCEYNYLHNTNNDNVIDDNQDYQVNPNLLQPGSTNRFPIIQCTPMFQCPEMLMEDMNELMILRNATKIDIWSTGITLYQLTTGQLPFQGTTVHQIFEKIRSKSHQIDIPDYIDKNLNLLLMNMLNRDPLERWSIKQIRDSEWFKRKHPIVQEDLARLPDDVINNESSTFRMINYLEKYCLENNLEPSDLNNMVIDPSILMSTAQNDIGNRSIQQQPPQLLSHHNNTNNDYSQKSTLNSNNTTTINNQKTKSIKLKKSQCNIM
jgi:serine/threonine-protein kinase 11